MSDIIQNDFEFSTPSSYSDNAKSNPSFDLNQTGQELEMGKTGCEFFPDNKQQKCKSKQNKSSFASMLIAAIATVSLGVAGIIASIVLPPPPTPSVQSIAVYDFTEITNEMSDFPSYKYDVGFTFDMQGCLPQSVDIVGEYYYDYGLDGIYERTPIKLSVPTENLSVDENGSLTVKYPITVDDPNLTYELCATLNYLDTSDPDNPISGMLTTDNFFARFPHFNGEGIIKTSTITSVITENEVICTFIFDDFVDGCFDFRAEKLNIDFNGDILSFGGEGEPALPTEFKDGKFEFTYTFPKPQGESVIVYAELEGDCYYGETKLNLQSLGSVSSEIVLGTAYSLAPIAFDSAAPQMSANGMTVKEIGYQTDYDGFKDSVPKMLPQRTVVIWLMLEGTAIENGTLTASVTVNEQKITDVVLTYAEVTVYSGDTEAILEISFTMPDTDILTDDIKINGITFTSEV